MTAETLRLSDPAWQAFVDSRPTATFFHRPSWAELLADCYGYTAQSLVVRGEAGAIVAGLPIVETRSGGGRRWIALPFTDHCGILGESSRPVLDAMDEARRRASVESLEIRGPLPGPLASHVEISSVRHTLDLTVDEAGLLRSMDRMHRGSLRKAERAGVRIEVAASSGLDEFYRLHLRTRRRLGVPIQPRKFFGLVQERILDRGKGFVITASLHGAPAAAGVFFVDRRTLVFKYSASDERYWEGRPNHLLAWCAIRIARERGLELFDWGRTEGVNEGLRTYKRAFGSREEPLPYSWIGKPPRAGARSALRRPLSALIRRSPEWVCQAFGETLYRYAS